MTDSVSFVPNSYSTPNAFADRLMHLLEPTEWKVLSCVTRHILGWQDKIATRIGAVSLTVLTDGFTTEDGVRYFGTGLSRPTVIRDLKNLVKFRVIVKVGKPTKDGQKYRIPENDKDINFDDLNKRVLEKFQDGQKRTKTASERSARKRSTGKSDVPAVVNGIYQQEYVAHTSTGKSDVPNISISNPYQNHKDSLSPIAIAPATEGESNKQINAVLEEVQKEQEAAAPSNDLILSEEKVSTPAAAPASLPKGTEARYVSRQIDQESWTHVEHLVGANVKTPDPVCKRCNEKLSGGIITQTPSPLAGTTYTRCVAVPKKPKAPPINQPLFDAIAQHIEGIEPVLAGGLTRTLAGMAGQVWKRKLGIQSLNAEQYNSIARSIPRFLEWYNKECEGCSPPKDRNKFESWYAKFCSGPITVKAPADAPDLNTKKAEETKQAMREAYGFEV